MVTWGEAIYNRATLSFDSLTFARRLKAAGFSEAQAEALADANREMVVHDLATKDDLTALEQRLMARA